jgi:uncharacterized protein (TIGR03492 family)
MSSLLVLSNGHGEDVIAGRIIDRLRDRGMPPAAMHAWPMVGEGETYRARGVTTVGVSNRLPSGGFATLSARWMWRDLRAGWIGVHAAQLRVARAMRERYTRALVVGDVVPMAAAVLAGLPFIFVGCAKSAYYGRRYAYSRLEMRWLRGHARSVFPRDDLTARWLQQRGVPARYVGNPMMDDLDPAGLLPGLADGDLVLAALPGSRWDASANVVTLMAVADALARQVPAPQATHVICAVARVPQDDDLRPWALAARQAGWLPEHAVADPAPPAPSWSWRHPRGLRFCVVPDRLGAVLHRSRVVIGLAGTANEQAVGLGKPVVTFPTAGTQDAAYVRMKMRFFGESAVAVARDPAVVARAILDILNDPDRAARMAAAGRQRMGVPGASAVIAAAVLDTLANPGDEGVS